MKPKPYDDMTAEEQQAAYLPWSHADYTLYLKRIASIYENLDATVPPILREAARRLELLSTEAAE